MLNMPRSYATCSEIETLFKAMETRDRWTIFKRVSPHVDWTVVGTRPCAGRYITLREFQEKTFTPLGKIMKAPGIRLVVRNVIGEQRWAKVELIANAEYLSGLKFDDTYARCMRFDESQNDSRSVRAYPDSWMVKQAIEENEVPGHGAPLLLEQFVEIVGNRIS